MAIYIYKKINNSTGNYLQVNQKVHHLKCMHTAFSTLTKRKLRLSQVLIKGSSTHNKKWSVALTKITPPLVTENILALPGYHSYLWPSHQYKALQTMGATSTISEIHKTCPLAQLLPEPMFH